MHLRNLSLINFKNYRNIQLEFSPKINCFVGYNGVGKTNLLDAIYYLSFCKSYFDPVDSHNIHHEENFFLIQGGFDRDGATENIYCGIRRNQHKQFRRNKVEYDKLSDHIGFIPLVMISPADIALISEGSEERRKFINNVISQYDKKYLEDLIRYNRALQQRNILLKQMTSTGNNDKDAIDLWNEQLVMFGEPIKEKRMRFSERFLPVFRDFYQLISSGLEDVQINYNSQLVGNDFRTLLDNSLSRDLALQYTSQGIHKDDLDFRIKGHPIKLTGSQGQQKTFLVALKLAQFNFISEVNGFKPILLLDDIFDKLDRSRVKQIVKLVAENNFGQIFITDTNPARLHEILHDIHSDNLIFTIDYGQLAGQESVFLPDVADTSEETGENKPPD
ncbi:MAG: DNA replication/repair protein RecF [Bacteroidia bacterium]|nr:DNA replication/repair protein RecF [Bacteroidia bacterium]